MDINETILQIIQDALPFEEEKANEYFSLVDDLHSKMLAVIPQKVKLTPETLPRPNTPLWLWHTGRNEPELAKYRADYPNPCFWPIVDGDYINYSNAIEIDKCTHYMYVNSPDGEVIE